MFQVAVGEEPDQDAQSKKPAAHVAKEGVAKQPSGHGKPAGHGKLAKHGKLTGRDKPGRRGKSKKNQVSGCNAHTYEDCIVITFLIFSGF
jgi:hypothetical protein